VNGSSFDGERWRIVSPYLDRALEMDGEERDRWLASLRAENPALAADLETLLEEGGAAGQERFLESTGPMLPAAGSPAGQTIGPYTLISMIGHGGMGSVWLARRSDGRFEAAVAVKLLSVHLLGRAGEERFKREGSILARLTHPHIARLLDAGTSPSGQPYLVLEHVEGEHIDRYCDGRNLGVEARLRLFLDVLEAVAHAHANLVVHRDIKPSNVLVSKDGQVKLLDFGIAKLLETEAESGQATALTRDGGKVLTPEYAAPEQVTGEPITTATDVYALGALLYVLLGGRHPAGVARSSPVELLRAIVEDLPQRLSDAVVDARTETAETLSHNASRRASTPDQLRRALRGDLDTLVAKALKKRPEERYPSVTALADDVRRYLGHQPISARPDTAAYRMAKFARRNRFALAAASLTALGLAIGMVLAVWQATVAKEQRDFALRQLSRAEAINELNTFLLSDAAPGGKPFTVGDLLARAEQIVERQRDETDENRAGILIAIGWDYQSLEESAKAVRVLTEAYNLARAGPDRATHAKAACALAGAVIRTGEFERAERLIAEGFKEMPEASQFVLDRIFCLLRAAEIEREKDPRIAVERVEEAQRLLREYGRGSSMLELSVAIELAGSYYDAGRNREAFAAFERVSAGLEAAGRGQTQAAAIVLNNWGLVARALGQPLRAEQLYRRALQISSGEGEQGVSPAFLNSLARCLTDLHRLPEARDYADRVDTLARRTGEEIILNQNLSLRASIERQLGHLDEAASVLAELAPRVRSNYPPEHVAAVSLVSEQGLLAQARGDLGTARAAQDRAIALAEANRYEDFLPILLLRRSDLALASGAPERARADAARALALEQRAAEPGTFSHRIGRAQLALGRALNAQGKLAEAQAAFALARKHLEPSLGADHPDTQEARRLTPGLT
jgi:eukaryotic-like serine/threonine-protein kinase